MESYYDYEGSTVRSGSMFTHIFDLRVKNGNANAFYHPITLSSLKA